MVRVEEHDEDAALMAAFVKTRDRRMFEQLFQRYRRAIVAHATRYVRDRGRAEELAQEIFVRVYQTKAYEPTAKFKTWIYRVATNACLNELRRPEHQQRHEPLEATVDGRVAPEAGLFAPAGTPEDTTSSRELAKRLERVLDELPTNQRAAFLMARHDSLSHEEIAEALSTSVPAVKSLIHRALEALRKEVEGIHAEPALRVKEATR
ncbi:sigma-70 family RNA polymerase sigma factor [Myxococcota bacterium]|nr:sigma-70 family RNA polymerase sigma factor [Myxococcota bacterium]